MQTRSLSPKHADAPLVPIIGMGTSKTLDTDDLALAGAVVLAALGAGTTLFDSPRRSRARQQRTPTPATPCHSTTSTAG